MARKNWIQGFSAALRRGTRNRCIVGGRRWAALPVAYLLLFLLFPVSGLAADPKIGIKTRAEETVQVSEAGIRTETIKVDVPLVLINVTVSDPMSRLVTGLEKEHFKLLEDKVEQEITQFGAEDAPLSLGIVFDASGSMGYKMGKAREAVAQFFRTANPEDEFFLIQFNDRPELMGGFTRSLEEIQNRLTFTQSKGRTALLDAIYLAINQMKEASNTKKALLVISDGGDNSSRYTGREIKRLVKEADVQIYAIGIFEPVNSRGRTPEELSGPSLLTEIAEQTGGRQFPVENLNELPDVAARIGIELRNQYVLGYVPKDQKKDGKWRRVRVTLSKIRGMPPLRAHYRLGYYAPSR